MGVVKLFDAHQELLEGDLVEEPGVGLPGLAGGHQQIAQGVKSAGKQPRTGRLHYPTDAQKGQAPPQLPDPPLSLSGVFGHTLRDPDSSYRVMVSAVTGGDIDAVVWLAPMSWSPPWTGRWSVGLRFRTRPPSGPHLNRPSGSGWLPRHALRRPGIALGESQRAYQTRADRRHLPVGAGL